MQVTKNKIEKTLEEKKQDYKIIKHELNIIQHSKNEIIDITEKEKEEKINFPSALSLEEMCQIINQSLKCVCLIKTKNKTCTGALCKINYKYKSINCLITNNEIINDNYIRNNIEIKVYLNEGKIVKRISIKRKKIKYINNKFGISILELDEEDNDIKDILVLDEFLTMELKEEDYPKEFMKDLKYGDYSKDLYKNISIYIPHYKNYEKIFVSFGTIIGFKDFNIIHCCNMNDEDIGPSGAPILDLTNKTLIGIYNHEKKIKGERCGIFLENVIKDFIEKKLKNENKNMLNNLKNSIKQYSIPNQIKLTIIIEKNLLGKKVFFLNNLSNKKDNKNNQNQINEKNTEIFINGEATNFSNFFYPKVIENEIILKFKTPLKDCSYMFYNCNNIYQIDLSQFNTSNVKNMESMFAFCTDLICVDLSFLDMNNIQNMDNMFFFCYRLEGIKLKHLGNIDTSRKNMFYSCNNLKILDLTSLNENDNFDIDWLIKENKKFDTIYVEENCKNKKKKYKLNIKTY